MADNVITKGRLVYLDPNDLASFAGFTNKNKRKDNVYWNPEELTTTVDLQVIVPNRSDCGNRYEGDVFTVSLSNTKDGGPLWASFLEGEKLKENNPSYLTDSYTDMSFTEIKDNVQSNKECLGIESVTVKYNPNFYPEVNIRFIDVHGYSLMNPAEVEASEEGKMKSYKSFFNALFHFPYPRFLLTIKGPFGTKVTYMLSVNEFHSSFNSDTGNFEVDVSFVGYMYGLYTDLPLNFLIIAPYIDSNGGNATATDTGEIKYETGSYWRSRCESGEFITKEGDKYLPTFVEFLNDYNKLKEVIAEKQSELLGDTTTVTSSINQNIKQINICKALKEDLVKMLDQIKTSVGSICKYKEDFSGEEIKINNIESATGKLVFWREEKDKDSYTWAHIYDNFKELLNQYTGSATLPCLDKLAKALTFEKYNGTTPQKTEQVDYKNPQWGEKTTIVNTEVVNTDSDYFYSQITNKAGKYYCVLDIGTFFSTIKSEINDLNSENATNNDASIKEEQEVIKSVLGYYPHLENIFRIIFAHIDTFMYHFYSRVIEPIKSQNRDISNYTGFDSFLTDVKEKSKFLPPFPATFKNDSNGKQRTLIYPEEYGDGNVFNVGNMPELQFVEELLQAAIRLHNEIDTTPEGGTGENGEEQANMKFLPLMPTDIYYSLYDRNPYENINFCKSEELCIDALTQMLYRGINMKFCEQHLYGLSKYFGTIEGTNYKLNKKLKKSIADYLKTNILDNLDEVYEKIKKNYESSNNTIFSGGFEFGNQSNPSIKIKNVVNKTTGEKMGYSFVDDIDSITCSISPSDRRFSINGNYATFLPSQSYNNDIITDKNIEGTIKIWEDDTTNEYKKLQSSTEQVENFITTNLPDIKTGLNDSYAILDFNTYWDSQKNDITVATFYGSYNMPYGTGLKRANNVEDTDSYETFIERAKDNSVNQYTFSDLGYMCIDGSGAKKVFEEIINKNELFTKTFLKENEAEENKKRLFLFALSCMPYGYGSLKTCCNIIFNGYNFKITKLPLGKLLYIGGLCYAAEYAQKTFRKGGGKKEHFLYPLFDFSEKDKGDDKIFSNTHEIKYLFDLKKGIRQPYLNIEETNIIEKSEDCVCKNIGIRKYLSKLFEKYAKKFGECYSEGGNIKEGSKLDSFLVSIFLKDALTLTSGQEPEAIKGNQFFGKQYLQQLLETLTNGENTIDDTEELANRVVDVSQLNTEQKLATYQSLKALYDKWLCSYNREQFILPSPEEHKIALEAKLSNKYIYNDKKEYDNFIFADSFYNDISTEFFINIKLMYEQLLNHIKSESNQSAYEFMAELAQDNKLLFLALPVYCNFLDADNIAQMFSPHMPYNVYNTLGPSLGNTYLVLYPHETSHFVEDGDYSEYVNDGFDLNDETLNIFEIDGTAETGEIINVPAFAVSFAKQNQQYFKRINVNMDNPRVTDYSIANTFELANVSKDGDAYEPSVIGQDLFSIYSKRSYTCTVEMMGCANIMPMMYFQLNNIPMFKGAYIIVEVEHSIKAGDMTTTFTGVKMSRNLTPYNKHIFNLNTNTDVQAFADQIALSISTDDSYSRNSNTAIIDSNNYSVTNVIKYFQTQIPCTSKACAKGKPYYQRSGVGICTGAVKRALSAGGIKGLDNIVYPIQLSEALKNGGWVVVNEFKNVDYNIIQVWVDKNVRPGDVITYSKGPNVMKDRNGGDGEAGHSCIYCGNGAYVSDFNHSFYVYRSSKKLGSIVRNYRIHRHKSLTDEALSQQPTEDEETTPTA